MNSKDFIKNKILDYRILKNNNLKKENYTCKKQKNCLDKGSHYKALPDALSI